MFGTRLKEERKRLSLTQPQLAKVLGSSKRTVIDWEKEVSSPKAQQLIVMSENGIDTNYLLTGKRTQPAELATDEAFLLDSFRSLDSERKRMALQFLIGGFDGLHSKEEVPKPPSASSNKVVNSPNTVINSPNSNISNSFNSQSGFTELPFLLACIVTAMMAWALGIGANYLATIDVVMSMFFGIPAVCLWTFTIVLAIFGNYASKKRQVDNDL